MHRLEKLVPSILVVLLGATLASGHSKPLQGPLVRPHSIVAGIDLGGMSREDAQKRLRVWWEDQRVRQLTLHTNLTSDPFPKMTAGELGVTLDDVATVASLPVLDLGVGPQGADADHTYEPVYKLVTPPQGKLLELLGQYFRKPRPARAVLVKGVIYREPEISTVELNEQALPEAVGQAIKTGGVLQLPLLQGPKRVPDEKLAEITDVVFSFSTRFPKRQYSRNSNIKLASSKLNGVIVLPGEKISFNGVVGMRTIERGFKLAGVYKHGRHDTGIGGGICQVSTTLYNACLFSDLKILRRSNHSMPVAYVPIGRDATVDYGNLDLVVQNDKPYAIAISSYFEPGLLTFRVLGKKDPSISVKLEQVGAKSWDTGVQIVQDPKLPAGSKEVVEKGSRGHSVTTYRLVYKNGVLQDRQLLNHSYYEGGEKIVAVGPSMAVPVLPKAGTRVLPTSVGHP
ncbi:MAG: VanW family protein [Fimbriimonas sp.]|nr:VanW family protein [Fimbriimonas sp.]